jgi:hypothetical protein
MEDGEILEAHETLREIQRADLAGLRQWMESRATKIENLVKVEYSSAQNVSASLEAAGGGQPAAQG